jgi:hypothetical protein
MNEAMEVSTYVDENQPGLSTINNPVQEHEAPQQEETPAQEGQVEQKTEETKPAKPEPNIPAPQTQEAAANTLKGVGLDITDFENEFISNGGLSDESYKKLNEAGIPKSMVDSYIKGQEAIAQKFIDEVYSLAGGNEGYASMTQWAASNVAEDELKAFNSIMASGKKELITLAVTGMVSRWKASEGSKPKLTQGRVSGPSRVQGYQSPQEMVKAMQDKRYGKDPAYTRAVEDRVARSNIFG